MIGATALPFQEGGQVIGEDGNIEAGTRLLIRNLPSSYEDEAIYAIALVNFVG
ncbi:MAG: hypothetical protein H6765_01620 [Candidatus Peribacteria bacterium]|nr:MAG: hypothetical protein H6765_01620 [Candidatus Peribacteria bacterium]